MMSTDAGKLMKEMINPAEDARRRQGALYEGCRKKSIVKKCESGNLISE